jgi:hypothetical protein
MGCAFDEKMPESNGGADGAESLIEWKPSWLKWRAEEISNSKERLSKCLLGVTDGAVQAER